MCIYIIYTHTHIYHTRYKKIGVIQYILSLCMIIIISEIFATVHWSYQVFCIKAIFYLANPFYPIMFLVIMAT